MFRGRGELEKVEDGRGDASDSHMGFFSSKDLFLMSALSCPRAGYGYPKGKDTTLLSMIRFGSGRPMYNNNYL